MPMSSSRNSTIIAGVGLTLLNRAAVRLGLKSRRDGWRRAAGLVLRGEESTFVLSALGLNAELDGESGLRECLQSEPLLHLRVRRNADEHRAELAPTAGFTLRFEARPAGIERFLPPDDWSGEVCGAESDDAALAPIMNMVCRRGASQEVDFWARVNHVATDGVPAQAMFTRLEQQWGTRPVAYPAPDGCAPLETPRKCPGREDAWESFTFMDFAPLLTWRREVNARLPEPMTVSAALLWKLGRVNALSRTFMGTTAEMGAANGLPPGVGVIVVRPGVHTPNDKGLARFIRAFNRELEATRRRASQRCQTLDAAAHLSSGLARSLLRSGLENGGGFGTLGLTLLRDARIFGAPIAEVGHRDGFIAVGSMSLPTATGEKVGCVCVKGPREAVASMPGLIRRAMVE